MTLEMQELKDENETLHEVNRHCSKKEVLRYYWEKNMRAL